MVVIFKSKKKIFRIRRKQLIWFKKNKNEVQKKKLSLNNYIWQIVSENKSFTNNTYNDVIRFSNLIMLENRIINKNTLKYYNLNFYINYIYQFDKYITINNSETKSLDFVVCSIPTCQPFFIIYKGKPKFIFSGGFIRKTIQLNEKSAKKNRLVFVNCISVLYKLINNTFRNSFFMKVKKNLSNLKWILDKKMLKNSKISYILLEPGINFGTSDLKKRSAIKKRLKKKMKVFND